MESHRRMVYPGKYSFPVGLVSAARILNLARKGSSLMISENLSIHIYHRNSPPRPFLSSNHPKPDSRTSRSPLRRTSGNLPVPSGRLLATAHCLKRSLKLQTELPQSKSRYLASYLRNGGQNRAEDWIGSMKRVN